MPQIFFDLISSAITGTRHFPPTIIFEEGWMLRILLAIQSKGFQCFPFPYLKKATWFSEAQLHTPFEERKRPDPLAEKRTHADGVIGHIKIEENTKTGLILEPHAKQFIVIEAKMKSKLSKGVTNAAFYDQASRTLACMSKTLKKSKNSMKDFESLAFYVIAPKIKIDNGIFDEFLNTSRIKKIVKKRVEQYHGENCYASLEKWYNRWFIPMLNKIEIDSISWEGIIDTIEDENEKLVIKKFYDKCYEFNI